jgi:hypothetical protein
MTNKANALVDTFTRLLGRNGQASPANDFNERLRWKTNRLLPSLGWPGIIAVGLLVMCLPFYFSTIRPMQLNLEAKQQDFNLSRDRALSHDAIDHSLDTPSEQLVQFYKFFPSEKTSPHWLGLMVDIAEKKGLALNHGEYAVVRDSVGQLRRFKITLPVQGTYPQIRQYLAALIESVPSMSLENVQFEREDINETDLQAKIKLVLYLRHVP